jgi:DNA-binding XRE family transcriptional regulator
MKNKLLTLNDVLKKKLKDGEFRKYYEEEGKKLQLGMKIAELREKSGLTQKQLAEKIHTSQAAIARIESGNYLGYSLRTLEKVAIVTGSRLEIQFRKSA